MFTILEAYIIVLTVISGIILLFGQFCPKTGLICEAAANYGGFFADEPIVLLQFQSNYISRMHWRQVTMFLFLPHPRKRNLRFSG